ncbi:LysR family transcriptional regulator [Rahnella bruchi]|uniref:LysR family transcriptional regulator n=1 Tax=Rahnella bruchi TaxID=1510573 RepID=UPI000EA2B3E6|nr:LysR family transcriptional regulator [Rahnella bruchi]
MKNKIEFKFLKIINILVMTGSVTKTAQLLNLTPGAISYSLKILRGMTGEHLFIRTRHGMKPDTTALELSQRYEIFAAGNMVKDSKWNMETRSELRFMTFSLVEMLLADSVFCLKNIEPLYRFVFLTYAPDINDRMNHLINRTIDIDIGGSLPPDRQISRIKIFTSKVSLLAGVNNTSLPDLLTVDDLQKTRHAIWSVMMDYYSDNILSTVKNNEYLQDRDVAIISGSIVNMVAFCASTQCVMLIPDIFIPMLIKRFPVKRLSLPDELDINYDCHMHFNTRFIDDNKAALYLNDIVEGLKAYSHSF